jgi:hypothetical protein
MQRPRVSQLTAWSNSWSRPSARIGSHGRCSGVTSIKSLHNHYNLMMINSIPYTSHRPKLVPQQDWCSRIFFVVCLPFWTPFSQRKIMENAKNRIYPTWHRNVISGWWFETFYIFHNFPYIGNNNPNWLFFRGVETTNQIWIWRITRLRKWVITLVSKSPIPAAHPIHRYCEPIY